MQPRYFCENKNWSRIRIKLKVGNWFIENNKFSEATNFWLKCWKFLFLWVLELQNKNTS